MSVILIQELHAGISRRDWTAVETAANAIRDESEKVRRCLAATDFGSLPADYSTLRMVEDRMEQLSQRDPAPQDRQMVIPPGWKLVPEEPTEEMIDAACKATILGEDEDYLPVHLEHREARAAYAAALAASPQPVENRDVNSGDCGED